jgi:hypothetical protein
MICPKTWLSLVSCLCGLLVASSALCDESKSSGISLKRSAHLVPSRLAAKWGEPVRLAPSLPFGLRLPKFLNFGGSSAPAAPGSMNIPRPTDCRADCASGPVTDRTRATASAILAGVGAAGVVTGVVLTFSKPRRIDRARLAPTFRVKLSGQRAFASADWRF